MKEKNGFTLIELLAVIVVLGVVVTIAATNVLPSMNTARESAFRTEATYLTRNAKEAYDSYKLGNVTIQNNHNSCLKDNKVCFTVSELVNIGTSSLDTSSYKGKVEMILENNNVIGYDLYLKKGDEYRFVNQQYSDFSKNGIINEGTWNENAEVCTCE